MPVGIQTSVFGGVTAKRGVGRTHCRVAALRSPEGRIARAHVAGAMGRCDCVGSQGEAGGRSYRECVSEIKFHISLSCLRLHLSIPLISVPTARLSRRY